MTRILVVDDDESLLDSFQEMLTDLGHEVVRATRGDAALRAVGDHDPDLLVMDIRMPGMDGLAALRALRDLRPRLPVIIMTGFGTTEAAIEAMKLGAFDYQLKPFEPEEMLASIENALEASRRAQRPVEINQADAETTGDALIGQSESMQQVYKSIGKVAPTDATVLLRGETGTGKELVARAIFQHSRRKDGRLVVVNCAAIPDGLLESELFGYERGAFTGAMDRRIGKFEQADGGTLFLDEIGDLPLSLQAKLLRVLQERRFERVGGSESVSADVRLIAATNADLEAAMARGAFREDLYHRLNVYTITLPPLRERREDIPRLAAYFLSRLARELDLPVPSVSEEVFEILSQRAWPGNVRELSHCIYRALIHCRGYAIGKGEILAALEASGEPERPADADAGEERLLEAMRAWLRAAPGFDYARFTRMMDRILIAEALRITHGNQSHAARLLGLNRTTLKAKMDRCGLFRQISTESL